MNEIQGKVTVANNDELKRGLEIGDGVLSMQYIHYDHLDISKRASKSRA
jgi:hypothetical protein